MESNILAYFYEIPDEWLVSIADDDWGKLEELCMLLALNIEINKQVRIKN